MKVKVRVSLGLAALLGLWCWCGPAHAVTPVIQRIPWTIKTPTLATGSFLVSRGLSYSSTGTPVAWSEQGVESFFLGNATILLGKYKPLSSLDFSKQMWLTIKAKKSDGTWVTIANKQLAVLWSFNSMWSDEAGHAATANTADTASVAGTASTANTATTATSATTCSNWTAVSCPDGQCLTSFTAAGTPTCVPCGSAAQSPPTVSTGSTSSIGQTGASLNGTVNPNGAATNGWFEYGLTASYGTATSPQQSMGSGSSGVALGPKAITSLTCGRLYHFRAMASNSGGTSNGSDQTFTTSACSQTPPMVTTGAATSISQTGASLNGTVNPNGGATNGWFEYGLTASYGTISSPQQGMGSGSSPVALGPKAIAGLNCGTTYHFRALANNAGGTTNGSDQTFTTVACSGTALPFDTDTWEGETWIGNGFEGTWFPTVTAGVADFAGEDCRVEMVRTKSTVVSKGQTVSLDIYPVLDTSGDCNSNALVGFGNYPMYNTDPIAAIVFRGAGTGADDGKVFFAVRNNDSWSLGNQIGTFTKNAWIPVTLRVTAGNVFSVNVGGQAATMSSPITSAQFQLTVTNHDSAAGISVRQVTYQ